MHKFLPALYIALWITLVAYAANATPSKQNRPNSLGIEQLYENPNIYLFAVPACGSQDNCSILKDEKGRKYTNLKFQPYNTMSLFEEPVLFCGDVSDQFAGKRGAMVVTYRRQATLNYRGIGCHDLDSVFEVPAPKDSVQ